MSEPSVSPADTPDYDAIRLRAQSQLAHFATGGGITGPPCCSRCGKPTNRWNEPCDYLPTAEALLAEDVLTLLAVGERDKAAELGPVPTHAGGPGKEETYWLKRKLQASIRHLRDIEDYYRPRSQALGSYNEQRADRARVIYEQITADFLHGNIKEPPEIVALRDARVRDGRQIAQLTEALEQIAGLKDAYPSTALREANRIARAVLAGEEDAA